MARNRVNPKKIIGIAAALVVDGNHGVVELRQAANVRSRKLKAKCLHETPCAVVQVLRGEAPIFARHTCSSFGNTQASMAGSTKHIQDDAPQPITRGIK